MFAEPMLQDRVTAYWNERGGDEYDAQPSHTMVDATVAEAWRAHVARSLPAAASDLLDAGTGTGFIALLAAELGHRVTGTDLAEGMLAVARRKAESSANPPRFLLGDAVRPDFPDGSFDVITSRHLLWTLVDPAVAVASWLRLLRPGGRLLAWDSLWWQAGMLGQPDRAPESAAQAAWRQHYSDQTLDALPFARLDRPEPLLEVIERAGFVEVALLSDPALDAAQHAAALTNETGRFPGTMLISAAKPGP